MLENHKLDFKTLKRLFLYLSPWKPTMGLTLVAILGARMIDAWIPIKLGWLAQEMLTGKFDTPYFINESMYLVAWVVVGYALDAFSVLLKSWVGSKALLKLREEVFFHIEKLPVAYFDKQPVGKLLTRTMHDVDQINQMLTESILPLFGSIMLFGLILGGMFWLDWRAALIITFLLPIILYLTNYFRVVQRAGYEKIRNDVQEINGFVQEHLSGVLTVRHFGLIAHEQKKFDVINSRLSEAYLDTTKNFGFYISGNDFLQSTALIAAYLMLSFTLPFDAGVFFAFSLYVVMIFRPLMDLAERYNILQSAFAAATRLFDILDTPEEEQVGEILKSIETIDFKDVWFCYNPDEWVLKGVSFHLNKGEKLGIVGKTGSGKSTIISLLLRFYTPQKGEILINGKPSKNWSLSSLRSAFSVVLQDPVILSESMSDNLSLFDPSVSQDLIKAGLASVQLETKQGSISSYSQGEKQLISLARVAAHPGKLLILDEATANIDPYTEKKIQATLKNLIDERGALVVAHRLSTIRDAHQILVLSQGVIVERGTHEELLSLEGIYEKLSRLEYSS